MAQADRLGRLRRLGELTDVGCRYLAMRGRARWTREKLEVYRRRRLLDLLAHTVAHSPFYRKLYERIRIDETLDLRALPMISKRDLLDHFDEVVTDPRLKRADVERYLEVAPPDRDDAYLDRYRVLATAGTTGLRGLFLFDRTEWAAELANVLRWFDIIGARLRPFGRLKISVVGAPSTVHVSRRLPLSGEFGLFRLQHLSVTSELDKLVDELNCFAPDILLAYPTAARRLAIEQQQGRLAIAPGIVSTHSELLTPETRRLIRAAWRVPPFDHYGLTEITTVAVECVEHRGLHLLDDLFIAEILDDRYERVEPGQAGSRLLLTSLVRRVQPLIRYEVSDHLRLSPEPCPCGRPFPLVAEIGGRSEEWLSLPGRSGPVEISPLALSATLEGIAGLQEFALHWDGSTLKVTVAPASRPSLRGEVETRLRSTLAAMGADRAEILVSLVEEIARRAERMGKVKMVETAPSPEP